MRVLLTNDDGVMAEGISDLRRAFEASGCWDVYVAAPDRERSASGHAITMHQPLRVDDIHVDGSTARHIWAISGTPADCAKLSVKGLMPDPPDIVVSGINRGPNMGIDVFYSGTVSAAIEACMMGIPAVAISLAAYENLDFAVAAQFGESVARIVAQRGLPPDTILNVNVPALPVDDVAGVMVTRLGLSRYSDRFEKRVDPRGKAYYWLTGELQDAEEGPETDIGAIKANLISITPLHLDLTHHKFLEDVKEWGLKIAKGNDGEISCQISE